MKEIDNCPRDARGIRVINRKPRVIMSLGLSPEQARQIKQYCATHNHYNVSGRVIEIVMQYINDQEEPNE
jgi:hypothetical protein